MRMTRKATNFRLSPTSWAILDTLSGETGRNRTEVVEVALRSLYDAQAHRPGRIVIDVRDATAYVSRINTPRFDVAANWQDLHDDAVAAIEAQGGYITLSGIYPCPAELAEKAQF